MHTNSLADVDGEQLGSFEKPFQEMSTDLFKMIAADFDKSTYGNDPEVYPGLMSLEDMKKLPPTIICTSEFDFLRRDALSIIPKLRDAGRLLDVLDMPVAGHNYES